MNSQDKILIVSVSVWSHTAVTLLKKTQPLCLRRPQWLCDNAWASMPCFCYGCFDSIQLKHDRLEMYFGRLNDFATDTRLTEEAGFHCVVPIAGRDAFGTQATAMKNCF